MGTIDIRISGGGVATYRARVRAKGDPAQTASVSRKTDAKKWIANTEVAIRDGRYFPAIEARRHTLADPVDKYEREVASASQVSKWVWTARCHKSTEAAHRPAAVFGMARKCCRVSDRRGHGRNVCHSACPTIA